MTSYETLWDFAEDHYGIVTTAQAMAMGIDKHMLPAMAKRGTLIKKGHGVYLAKHHIPHENQKRVRHRIAQAGTNKSECRVRWCDRPRPAASSFWIAACGHASL